MSIVECRLSIELFGVLTRLVGAGSVTVRLRAGATVADALSELAAAYPATGAALAQCACAVGDSIVPRTRSLAGGDRLALLPPVSGG